MENFFVVVAFVLNFFNPTSGKVEELSNQFELSVDQVLVYGPKIEDVCRAGAMIYRSELGQGEGYRFETFKCEVTLYQYDNQE